ncbi:hypothetical protein HD806DRAFT_477459 [Xylariaceae sp. AK1471]|nr:hypothetical protein HD806DRAFT_477459 [Xylariaceae sp. AK1471]
MKTMETPILLLTNMKLNSETITVDLTKFSDGGGAGVEAPTKTFLPDGSDDPPTDPCPDIDRELRMLVAGCMTDAASDRPSLSLDCWKRIICTFYVHRCS